MAIPVGPTRIYLDTSVFGGAFDVEFAVQTAPLIDRVRRGTIKPVVSAIVREEIQRAPSRVLVLFKELDSIIEAVDVTPDVLALRDAYLAAGIVTPRSRSDAGHVAAATVSRCHAIVSWNFKHIVNARLMPLYNAVNTLRGYPHLAIHAPPEIPPHGDEERV